MTQTGASQDSIVWIDDPDHVFVKARLLSTSPTNDKNKNAQSYQVVKLADSEKKNSTANTMTVSQIYHVNPTSFDKVADLSELTYLNEPSVLYNLNERYNQKSIYTYSGLFLVAINPYSNIKIYGKEYVDLYMGTSSSRNDDTRQHPHIFAIAQEAYSNLLMERKNQSILVTGESGAGKTENTKKILQYLANVTTTNSPPLIKSQDTTASNDNTLVTETFEQKILKSNPILESFGNAQTVKNNNSSRFGKFIKIEFDKFGKINGAHIDWYLLEKSRVSLQSKDERNYHIFYQLLSGLSQKNKTSTTTTLKNLGFTDSKKLDPSYWNYLKINSNCHIPGIDDQQNYIDLLKSFNTVGFSEEQQFQIFQTISIILHLGNIEFNNHKDTQASIVSDCTDIVTLLGVDLRDFQKSILTPRSKAGREFVYSKKTPQQSKNIVNSLSKIIYEKLFDYIVMKINENLDHGSMTENYIGLLDIAGFEIFENNSFEQLLINFTNENLQQFFNHHMFILEQNEYLKENIQWDYIDYGRDLQTTIDLITKPPSILSLLDEESIIPNSSDLKFFDRMMHSCSKNDRFKNSKLQNHFILKHYAGDVEYNVEDWLHKNKEPLNDHLLEILSNSGNPLIKFFFQNDLNQLSTNGTIKFKTQSQRHKFQLTHLINNLADTNPLFVRCIIPNTDKCAGKFDKQLVLDQLRCNGVLEGIRISREGYPNRIFFKDFYQRYTLLVSEHSLDSLQKNNSKKNCEFILSSLRLDPGLFKVGNTKLFFKAGVLANIEQLKQQKLAVAITKFNSIIKGDQVRMENKNKLEKINAAAVLAKTFEQYNELSKNQWYKLFVNIKPMLTGDENDAYSKKNRDYIKQIKQLTEKLKSNETLQKELNALNENLKKELQTNKQVSQDQTEKIENYTRVLSSLEKSHSKESESSNQILQELQQKFDNTIQELSGFKTKDETYNKRISETSKTIDSLQNEKQTLEQTIKEKETQFKKYVQEQKAVNDDKLKLLKQIESLQQNEVANKKNILNLKTQLNSQDDDVESKLQQLEKNFTGANKKLQKLLEENQNLRDSISSFKAENLEISNKLKSSHSGLEKLNDKHAAYQQEINQITKSKEDLFEQLNQVNLELKTLRTDYAELQKKYATLEETFEAYKLKSKSELAVVTPLPEPRNNYADPIILEKVQFLEKELHKEKLLNGFLHQKALAVKSLSASESSECTKENYDNVTAELKDCKHLLLKSIKDKEESIARLKFLRNRLASASIDNQVMSNQIKKLKDVISSTLKGVNIDDLLKNVGMVDDSNAKLALQIDDLKEELHKEKTARQDAEYSSRILSEKFSLSNSLSEFGSAKAIDNFASSYRSDDRARNTSFDYSSDERIVQYKTQMIKLQETIADYNSQVLKLNEELQSSKSRERYMSTELKTVQQDLAATEQQNHLYLTTIQDYKQQCNSITSNLLDCQNDLREVQFELKRSDNNIEKLQSIVKTLQSQGKVNEKLIWEKENEVADLEDELSSKEIDLEKLKHVNELLKSDVAHLNAGLQDFKKDDHYIDQINGLNRKLADFSRNEIELTKEIASLKYNMDQLEQEADSKIQELLQQNEHYLKMSTALSKDKAELEKTQSELETQLSLMDKENVKLNGMIDKLTQDNMSLAKEREKLLSELDSREAEMERDLNSSTSMRNEYSQLKNTLVLQDEQIKRNEQFVSKLNENNIQLKDSLDSLKQDYMDLQEENKAILTENKEISFKFQALQQKLNDPTERNLWLNKINELERQVNQESNSKFEEVKKNKFLERELNELTEKLDQHSELLIMASKDREDFEREALQSSNKLTYMEKQLSAQITQSKNLERETISYKTRVEQLEQELTLWKQKYSVRN